MSETAAADDFVVFVLVTPIRGCWMVLKAVATDDIIITAAVRNSLLAVTVMFGCFLLFYDVLLER
jgi:tetrahydromethanopterin S-methyltransferase subunit H